MTGIELYPLVYHIVKRAQKQNIELKKLESYYNWSTRIPEPKKVSKELADALCSSVSHSAGVGLEIYFQEKVFIQDLNETNTNNIVEDLLENNNNGERYQTIGRIIRTIFDGRMLLNSDDLKLLNSI